jgi:hypothetical protein
MTEKVLTETVPAGRWRAGRAEESEAEGQLCTALLIAASGGDRSLTRDEVDQVLGVRPRTRA